MSSERTSRTLAHVVGLLSFAFLLRVMGQAVQKWTPVAFLPPFEEWQGSALPYPVLLGAQILILAIALWVVLRMYALRPVVGRLWRRAVAVLGAVYFVTMAVRIILGLSVMSDSEWFTSWISSSLHLALATNLILISLYQRRLSVEQQ